MNLVQRLRNRLSYANVVASLALFAALGGSSYAAITVSGRNVKDNTLTTRDIKNNSVASRDVRNRSLLATDFKSGQLPSGPQGSPGPRGPQGAKGDAGPPATKLLAVVAPDCTAITRSQGVQSIGLETPSRCDVKFNQDVSACYPVVTGVGINRGRFTVSTAQDDADNQAPIDPDEVGVRYFTADGGTSATTRRAFSLAVFC